MKGKFDCIMLVDNSPSDNYLHEKMILRMGYAKHVVTMRTGHGAIDHINSYDKKQCLPPQLILLKVEMPGMSGWQFVEAYNKLHDSDKTADIIMMLESDEGPDKTLIKSNPLIKDYVIKPMTDQSFQGLMQMHYPS